MPSINCKICQASFYAKPSHIKKGYCIYCSIKCRAEGQKKGKYLLCELCHKKTWKTPRTLKRSKSNKFFCNKSCQAKWRNKKYSGKNHPNWQGGCCSYRELMIRSNAKPLCKECNVDNINILVVHHKDHNRSNNHIDNLIWLCRNCHYLIHLNT